MAHNIAVLVRLFACLLFCNCAIGAPLTKGDLVGTYRVDVSGAEDAETVPTQFYNVALKLSPDGSFATTNAPVNFFFPYPLPTGEEEVAHGTWKVRYVSGDGLITTEMIDLTFATASWKGSFSAPVKTYRGIPRIKVLYRSEERRVGKECRSRWSPYH